MMHSHNTILTYISSNQSTVIFRIEKKLYVY